MDTLDYITNKYSLDLKKKSPFYINAGKWDGGMARLFMELGFKIGAEIGVQAGKHAEVLLKTIPGLKLYGIDVWTVYEGYRDIVGGQKKYDKNYKDAKTRTDLFDCELIKKWSMDAVKDFADESLDFVYLDANHDFPHITEDINAWEKKIKKGGIISGHDFYRSNRENLKVHVKDVVQAWTYSHQIHPWFVLTGSKCPNWMWIKKQID